jgi:GNAT superfamily N-acetyltransferase
VSRTIRTANAADLDLLIACDDYAQTYKDRRLEIASWIEEGSCYVGEANEDVFGFIVLEHRFFAYDFVPLVCVMQEMRRKNLGLALFEAMEQKCRSLKLFTSTNESNIAAIRLFEKAGFTRSGTIENLDDDDPEIVFFKRVRD